ncbi:MAG: AAA family ATPase [Deltaproteobacteria bacterium]|jgi:AAA15 family ATPase/GTPase|nr:AAA family ATPase [Deltaproteobacteria bacterium]
MLKTLKIQKFTCFPEAELEFSKGLNVIVGENGTGKTQLLKLGYTALYVASKLEATDREEEKEVRLRDGLIGIFKPSSINKFFSFHPGKGRDCVVSIELSKNEHIQFKFYVDRQFSGASINSMISNSVSEDDILNSFDEVKIDVKNKTILPIFIPAKELLSIYPGLAYEIRNRKLAFDDTYLHLADALEAQELQGEALKEIVNYAEKIEKINNNICIKSNEKFFLKKLKIEQGILHEYPRIEAHLAAEGDRKIGMLSYLMRNGTLRPGASLFWDEPEANLNPKLIKKLAEVLIELSKIMQITIATHSLFLLRELDICLKVQGNNEAAMFTGLHPQEQGGVICLQSTSLNEVGDIAALDASLEQSERFMKSRMS